MGRWQTNCGLLFCAVSLLSAQPAAMPSERLLAPFGVAHFSRLYRTAIDAYFVAQAAYLHQDYAAASSILESLWKLYPPGSPPWIAAMQEAESAAGRDGVYFGTPPCYYALRMLTECVTWRMKSHTAAGTGPPIRLAVVLVGHSSGIQPTTRQELQDGGGRQVRNTIQPELLADGNPAIHQASWLFCEYVLAMTQGKMPVELRILPLPDLDIPMRVANNPHTQPNLSAELASGDLSQIWQAIGSDARSQIDWWWVLYPSHRPEDYPELAGIDFSNGGGTTVGPDGKSFATFGDDLALLRKPPRYRKTLYAPEDRIVNWAQILQHEFFHHLFASYPNFQLEAASHQWFDRGAWPAGFEGRLEADYYAEALHKRLQPAADPPLYVKLRYAVPASVLAKITPGLLLGAYRRLPVENHWHEGKITVDPKGLRWTNQANAAWELAPDLGRLLLRTGPDNPYYRFGLDGGRSFRVVLRRGASGEYLPEISGFEFLGDFYRKY